MALIAEKHLSVRAQREVAMLVGPPEPVSQEEVQSRKGRGLGCKVEHLDAFARASIG